MESVRKDKHFSLNDTGEIFYQPDASNPLPGISVARLEKGEAMLVPRALPIEGTLPGGFDSKSFQAALDAFLKAHIDAVLEPLALLSKGPENADPLEDTAAQAIVSRLMGGLGVLYRGSVAESVAALSEAGRTALRARKVRMGPVMIYLPTLGKPAAVRLRAMLWTLWHDRPLPAPVPHDGMTSFPLPDEEKDSVDFAYYRAIGYPVYGGRAIRVDMLDRLVGAVYDGAKDGQFQAQHAMAEWLGCGIPALYAVLEALGHRKIHDPADDPKEETTEEATPNPEQKEESAPVESAPDSSNAPASEKPALATFRLRRGKAAATTVRRPPQAARPVKDEGEKRSGRTDKKPDSSKKRKHDPRAPRRSDDGERVYSAPAPKADPADSPFAVLGQLKGK
ncbi:MAG: hypothetical protein KDJ15_07085 [Alphaproteobacteria bacterium]|nr:hypothetical protein [Alphaproteobacteria bacterium]